MVKKIFLFLTLWCCAVGISAQRSTNDAKQIFEEAYNQVFGPQGCTLHYDVNLVGVYKSQGTIWLKEKKSKFEDSKVIQWNDGQTAYSLFKKKKVVEIYDVSTGKHDKYGSKFKFTLDDFDYSMERSGEYIIISMKQRRGVKGTVKQAKVALDARTHAPRYAKIKVTLFWANITISNFKSGGIKDDIFVFPHNQYSNGYRYDDKR